MNMYDKKFKNPCMYSVLRYILVHTSNFSLCKNDVLQREVIV